MNQAENKEHPFWVWTFKFYDIQKKKWCKSNSTDLHNLNHYRKYILSQKNRYKEVGDIYQRRIDIPHEY